MSVIPFTDRELRRAWRDLSALAASGAATARRNSHRLLLFYAVECGLKAVWLKRKSLSLFDSPEVEQTGHDLRHIIKELGLSSQISLPSNVHLCDVKNRCNASVPRNGNVTILHQVWRYGGQCTSPTDDECGQQLQQVLAWIDGELK